MYSLLLFLSLFLCSAHSQLQECGGILKVAEVQLKSPGYPGITKPNVSCEWILQPVSDKICRLEVEFNLADLHDASLVIAGVAHSGSLAGIRSFSFHNSTTISFRNGKDISKGFNIILKQKICEESLTPCGSVFSSREVIINGPPFAIKDCSFIIKQFSSEACQVEIYFQKLFLESSPECIMGRLEIGKDILCGNFDGYKRYDFNRTELEIRFHTDNISLRNKFSLKLSQVICSRKTDSFDKLEDFTITQKINVPFLNNNPSEINYNYGSCCNKIYSERHFLIASPGFPNSNNIDCTYTIQKFSPEMQFLKLNFKYFWVGDQDNYYYNCYGGYLQIDGNFFCGCQTGQTWIEQFNFYSYPEYKTMRLSINQHSQNRFIGFVIEVTQCQSIGPLPNHYKRQLRDNFTDIFIKNDSSGVSHISKPNGKESKNERLILNKTNDDFTNRKAKLQSHENIGILPDLYCLTWSIKDWIILLQQAVWAQLHCPINREILPSISKISLPPISAYNQPTMQSNCSEIQSEHGWIQFPDPVPSVLHDEYCFRFIQIPERCTLEVVFHEINLPLILDCSQNYIFITGIGKLCFIPNHKTVQIDFRKESTEIQIKRRGRIGKGIHLHFQQLPCSSSTTTIYYP